MNGKKMPIYYKCNMTFGQHLAAYLIAAVGLSVVCWLFYHVIWLSAVVGFLAAIFVERIYAKSTITKRQKALRLQFKDFLSSMSVACRAGNVEKQAIEATLKDLRLSYNEKADIVIELQNIIMQSEKGGIELKKLFEDLADRSGLEDIASFATIYSVIEGKSDRFGDIVSQTEEIIREKIEVEQEIETTITSAKTETNTMLCMPVLIVVVMSMMGSGLMDSLFTTWWPGHIVASIALLIFAISFILSRKAADSVKA